ncbi:phosphoethanolamine--lipid A transferase [Comamonas sp. Y33R10-2]|uniref:phosphoethanolamine transferase n=1 Tax=Comamonas sp. Y33R10-2 TaxID=2853257 RepID=UPI001C5C9DE2|nr:phosphoethanolamine--lipid A transferase [Comamonas sp. Y33R10-2]QXZ09217.1 phosphoethanolamine--lipid A transferase [Comamonas sp. Y33R10-2]
MSHLDSALPPSRKRFFQPRTPQFIALALALWLTLTANWALWLRLPELEGYHGSLSLLVIRVLPLVLGASLLITALFAWPRFTKPFWIALLLVAASAQYFMVSYGTVMDKGMIHNILQTDARESADLFNIKLIAQMLVIAILPAIWLWKTPLKPAQGILRNMLRTVLVLVLGAALIAAALAVSYKDLAPVVRNNLWLRYMFNPINPVLSAASVALDPIINKPKPFASITTGAALGTSYAAAPKPPLLVLVVGETARAKNFSLNGYERDTNPELSKLDVLSWRNARSCGTSTRESVPCMFSNLGREGYYASKVEHDNLLDVIQAAGLAVLWIDNQAGCKGVCKRIPMADTADSINTPAGKALCGKDGECLDGLLLSGLDERIAKLDPVRRAKGLVLVMHQMGSHGPEYFKRSTPDLKAFKPECATNALSSCSKESVVNVYDNSIRYTDHFLAQTISWLKGQQDQYETGMFYMSDHGESLGELGVYLHGMPYAMAPVDQKHVPMIAWLGTLGARTQLDQSCLSKTLDQPLSHDNLFHTVLGLVDVTSPTYQRPMDAFSSCRTAS